METKECEKTIWGNRGFLWQCQNKAKVERDGKSYCTIHDPEYIKARDTKRRAKWRAEHEAKVSKFELQNTAVRACKEINPDNPLLAAQSITKMYEALKALVNIPYEESGLSYIKARQVLKNMEGK